MSRPSAEPTFTRMAFVPGLLGAIILLAGLALIGQDWYTAVRFTTSIFALIICVFIVQARQLWWLILMIPVAVIWNPVFPIPMDDFPLRMLHILGTAAFIAVAIAIKVPADNKG